MADNNPDPGRKRPDSVAVVIGLVAFSAIVAIVILSAMGRPIPGSLDGLVYTLAGALGGAYSVKANGDSGQRNGGNRQDAGPRPPG